MLLLCSCRSWFAAAIGWGAQCRCCSVSAGGPFGAAPRQGVMRSLYLQEGGGALLAWGSRVGWRWVPALYPGCFLLHLHRAILIPKGRAWSEDVHNNRLP